MSAGAPPVIPDEFQIYDSYKVDPKWQRKFTAIWASVLGFAIILSVPHVVRAVRTKRAFVDLAGIRESLSSPKKYATVGGAGHRPVRSKRMVMGMLSALTSFMWWTPIGIELSIGQLILILGYIVSVLVCIVMKSELSTNGNRAGFLALAQLPPVFLFATKNSPVSLLLGPGRGYERLNFVHRWAGRGLFLAAVIHGSIWINDHRKFNRPILGQEKETSGIAALGVLSGIVLTSLRPVRRWLYQGFFITHVLGYVSFFITICYHTEYAPPWIFPPLAFYGFDLFLRFLRYRLKDSSFIPVDRQMTLIQVYDCDAGWHAGQHVRLRAFIGGRLFESHPLTIFNAPSSLSCLSATSVQPGTIALGARAVGDWTRALNDYAHAERARLDRSNSTEKDEKNDGYVEGVPVQVMLDGPYGGCSLDLGEYENVLLVAGGSGATFTLGVLDDLIGHIVKRGREGGEKTRRIEFVWCIRSFGALLWFSPMLKDIAHVAAQCPTLDLHISVYVTCLCDPEAVPDIPNSLVTMTRPEPVMLLRSFIHPGAPASGAETIGTGITGDSVEVGPAKEKESADTEGMPVLVNGGVSGGVGVCVAGPESLARGVANAVARIGMVDGASVGGIDLHTEVYAL